MIFRCLYRRCPPLPIPNREVKPARADGIAVTGGRVGRCRILYKKPLLETVKGFLVFIGLGSKPSAFLLSCYDGLSKIFA